MPFVVLPFLLYVVVFSNQMRFASVIYHIDVLDRRGMCTRISGKPFHCILTPVHFDVGTIQKHVYAASSSAISDLGSTGAAAKRTIIRCKSHDKNPEDQS